MMYQLDILAFGVVRAWTAPTGLVSDLLIQSTPGFNSLRSHAIGVRRTHEKGEPNFRFLSSQFCQGMLSSIGALGRGSADHALCSLLLQRSDANPSVKYPSSRFWFKDHHPKEKTGWSLSNGQEARSMSLII
jgi:hypothetical protein